MPLTYKLSQQFLQALNIARVQFHYPQACHPDSRTRHGCRSGRTYITILLGHFKIKSILSPSLLPPKKGNYDIKTHVLEQSILTLLTF